jgi:hypothetical protein
MHSLYPEVIVQVVSCPQGTGCTLHLTHSLHPAVVVQVVSCPQSTDCTLHSMHGRLFAEACQVESTDWPGKVVTWVTKGTVSILLDFQAHVGHMHRERAVAKRRR